MTEPDETTQATVQAPCGPCKGAGSVVSALGGEQRQVPCPWCGGTGVRQPGRDAQEAAAAARAAG